MQDEIKTIRELITGKTNDKQGISRNPFEITVMNAMQTAQQSISSKMVAPGPQVETLIENAEKAIKAITDKINNFYSGKWANYKQQVENTKVNLF